MRFVVALILLVAGCASHPVPPSETICWSRNIAGGVFLWRAEYQAIYHKTPVILCCHGGASNGRWVLRRDDGTYLDAETAVATLHEAFPGRPILLLSCNEGHFQLKTPGVMYAMEPIWAIPGPRNQFSFDSFEMDSAVGDVRDFVTTK